MRLWGDLRVAEEKKGKINRRTRLLLFFFFAFFYKLQALLTEAVKYRG